MKVKSILAFTAICFASIAQAAQPPSIKVQSPLPRTMAYDVKWDSLNPLEFKASLSFSNAQEQAQSQGLFAGGKVKLQVFSEQMWFLENTDTEEFPPKDPALTNNSSGQFTLVFLNRGAFISKNEATATKRIQIPGKKFAAFETPLIDIPLTATDIRITLIHTIDVSKGNPTSSQTVAITQPIRYVQNSTVLHLRGLQNPNPKDQNSAQFLLMESTASELATSIVFEESRMYDERWISMKNHDPAIRQKYEEVIGKPFDPSLLRPVSVGLCSPTRIPKCSDFHHLPATAEFLFFFRVSAQTSNGLVGLGDFFDSPTGDLSRGWKINLK